MNRIDFLFDLVQRFKRLKSEGGRRFQLWHLLKESQLDFENAKSEAVYERRRREDAEEVAESLRSELALRQRDPLKIAHGLLFTAEELLRSETRNAYEIKSWLAEFRAYRFEHRS